MEAGSGLGANVRWSLLGNTAFTVSQLVALLAIVRVGSAKDAAAFVLAFAITAPVFLILGLNLRASLASDIDWVYGFRDYVGLRVATTVASLATVGLVAVMFPLPDGGTAVVVLVGVAKAVESVQDLAQGTYLRAEDLRTLALSQLSRGIAGYGAFSVVVLAGGSIVDGVVALIAGLALSGMAFDARQTRRVLRVSPPPPRPPRKTALAMKSAPLGLERGLAALSVYLPLLVLQTASIDVVQVAAFAVVSQSVRAVQLLARSAGFALLPRLSRLRSVGDTDSYRRLANRYLQAMTAVGLLGIIVAVLVGDQLIRLLFGDDLVLEWLAEITAIGGGAIAVFSAVLTALTALRSFSRVLAVRAVSTFSIGILAVIGAWRFGVLGAGAALAVGTVCGLALGYWILRRQTSGALAL